MLLACYVQFTPFTACNATFIISETDSVMHNDMFIENTIKPNADQHKQNSQTTKDMQQTNHQNQHNTRKFKSRIQT